MDARPGRLGGLMSRVSYPARSFGAAPGIEDCAVEDLVLVEGFAPRYG